MRLWPCPMAIRIQSVLLDFLVFVQRQPTAIHLPPGRQQLADSGLVEAIINQVDHALVFDGADDAPGSLNNLLQSGVEVGVVVAVVAAEHHFHALFDFFVDRVDLRQAKDGKGSFSSARHVGSD